MDVGRYHPFIEKCLKICLFFFPLRIMRYHSFRIEKFIKNMALECDKEGKILLDVGSQVAPYRKYFKKLQYLTQDIEQSAGRTIDFVGDITEGLPIIKNNSVDYILCTQVLEHLKKPHAVFKEFERIIKPGGKLYLTTHLCFEEHMIPYDFFRFTRYGLAHLGEECNFDLAHIEAQGGVFHLLALIITTLPVKLFIQRNSFFYYAYFALFLVPIFIINLICYFLDFLDRKKDMTLNYECIYVKKN